jgi:hypothetical protein
VREFALGVPGAYEEFPRGESVANVNKKVFAFLGHQDADTAGYRVKLKDPSVHADAMAVPGAGPTGHGLGKAGWVSVPSGRDAVIRTALRMGGGELPCGSTEAASHRTGRE